MKSKRSLMMAIVALGLVVGATTASAQVARGSAENIDPQVVFSFEQLGAQGIYVSCGDNLAYVNGPSIFAPNPETGEKSGWVYNTCMYLATKSCSKYKDGQQVSIPGECVSEGRGKCEWAKPY